MNEDLRSRLLRLLVADEFAATPPVNTWERQTVDDASAPRPTWGLSDHGLQSLAHKDAVREVHARLQALFPDVCFHHMPAPYMRDGEQRSRNDASQRASKRLKAAQRTCSAATSRSGEQTQDAEANGRAASNCNTACHGAQCHCFVGNAVVHGDVYQWHVDADSTDIPAGSAWAETFGSYPNRVRRLNGASHMLLSSRVVRSRRVVHPWHVTNLLSASLPMCDADAPLLMAHSCAHSPR